MEVPDNSLPISSPRGRPTFTFSNSVDCSFRLRRGHGVRAGTPDSRKEKRHGTDDHRRQEQHRGRASPRPLYPRNREAGLKTAADRHQRDQVEAHRLGQRSQDDELDVQVVRGMQEDAGLRHALRHEQVVQELPPVLPAVQGLRGPHLREALHAALRLQRMQAGVTK